MLKLNLKELAGKKEEDQGTRSIDSPETATGNENAPVQSPVTELPGKDKNVSQMPLGFKEENRANQVLGMGKRIVFKGVARIQYSGLLTNFWLVNIVLFSLSTIVVFLFYIQRTYGELPESIGMQTGYSNSFDTLIWKEFIYSFPVLFGLIVVAMIGFGIKYGRKLNHLLFLHFVVLIALGAFMFFGLRNLVGYFS
ncbi:MAG: hypothetical protein ACOCXT_04305 [Candidatus Dojkabacteria bacterium]